MKVVALYRHDLKLEERPKPKIGEEEILLRVRACGLCGTDLLKIKKGSVLPGTVLGHELVGVADQVGSKVSGFKRGDRLVLAHHVPCNRCHYCRHGNEPMCRSFRKSHLDPGGFAEWLRIPADHVKQATFPVPESLTDEEALFMEPVSCVVRAVRRSELQAGDKAVIVGLGSIGLLFCQLLLHLKIEVRVTDLLPERLKMATSLGALPWNSNLPKSNLLKGKEPSNPQVDGVDMVLFTAGSPELLQESLPWVRSGGKLHLFASLDGTPAPLAVNDLYHREITLLTSYSSTTEDLRTALKLLAERVITPKTFGWEAFSLSEIRKGVEKMKDHQTLKAIIYPSRS